MNFDNIKFRFPKGSATILRNIDIALKIANGEKTKDLTNEYRCSITTILSAYKKICRYVYHSIKDFPEFTEIYEALENSYYYGIRACNPSNFVRIFEEYKKYIKNKIALEPAIKWLALPSEIQEFHQKISNRLNTILVNAEKKRLSHINFANKEFDVIKNQINFVMTELDIITLLGDK